MAKVLNISIRGVSIDNDPGRVIVNTAIKIMQTGQSCIADEPDITVQLKNQAQNYKIPAVLNGEIVDGVVAYVGSNFSITGFDKVNVIGGFSSQI